MSDIFKIFISYGGIIPICIIIGSYMLLRYTKIPRKIIPVVNLLVGMFATFCWYPLIVRHYPVPYRIFNGFLYGCTATGLHQLYAQTKMFIAYRQFKRKKKNHKKNLNY